MEKQGASYQPTTLAGYRNSVTLFARTTPHATMVQDVRPADARQFLFWGQSERHWKPSTAWSYRKHLRTFFGWAKKRRLHRDNPFKDLPAVRLGRKLPKALSQEEAERLLDLAACLPGGNEFIHMRNYAIIAVLLHAGLRRKEVLALKVHQVDLTNNMLAVRGGKGNVDRMIPINVTLHGVLARYLTVREQAGRSCPEFFTSSTRDRGLSLPSFKNLIEDLRGASGISFSAHILRHTFATMMLRGGCDIYTLSRLMGHADITTTTIYLSVDMGQLQAEVARHPLNYHG